MRFGCVATMLALVSLLFGCQGQPAEVNAGDGSPGIPAPRVAGPEPSHACTSAPAPVCSSVQAELRVMMIKAMERRLTHVRETLLKLGKTALMSASMSTLLNTSSGSVPGLPGAPQQHSRTNNQVPGVHEADRVKTDGEHLYVVAGSSLKILDVNPPAGSKIVASVTLPGRAHRLLLRRDRVVVYSLISITPSTARSKPTMDQLVEELLLGTRCGQTEHHTAISVFDVARPAAPRLLRELRVPASLVAARRVGAVAHTIFSLPDKVACKLRYIPSVDKLSKQVGDPYTVSDAAVARIIDEALDTLRADNVKIINRWSLSDWLPGITQTDLRGGGKTTVPMRCSPIFGSARTAASQLTVALSWDISKQTTASATVLTSPPGVVYSTASSLYLASSDANCMRETLLRLLNSKSAGANTDLYRLCLSNDPPGATFEARGSVPGSVLNQFSMDEHQGYLRIATTSGRCSSSGTNTLSVLGRSGEQLEVVGRVDDLARNETIRAVRYQQDRGYVVTFRKTDPLFVFDLADPRKPTVLSELKVSGYATYMHSMDRDNLLTIGYEADSGTGRVEGMKLQIFDVKDPAKPGLAHSATIGDAGTTSEALEDHLAVTYYPPKNLLAFPVSIKQGSGQFQGLMLYRITTFGGFHPRGRISHAGSEILRSVVLGDHLLTVSDRMLKISTTATPPVEVKGISL